MPYEPEFEESLLDKIELLQNQLIGTATHGGSDNAIYVRLRRELLANASISHQLPRYIRTCADLNQFWQFIKYKFPSYAERRQFIWNDFRSILDSASGLGHSPATDTVSDVLQRFNAENVHRIWSKALERKTVDPEGALTTARTLLETVCKHILDEIGQAYSTDADLPKLYRMVAENLKLAPSQHSESIFRQILGGCQAVIEGLGAARNRLSDSHGQGKKAIKPASRHAELAVNLAGSMALFLVSTCEARKETPQTH